MVDIPGQPAPEIDTPFGDGWLNRAEKKEGSMLTGTTGVTGSGQTVSVIIGGKPHNAAVSDDGHWSLPLAPGTMSPRAFAGHTGLPLVVARPDSNNITGFTRT